VLRFLETVAHYYRLEIRYENLQNEHPGRLGVARPAKGLIVLDISIRGTRQEKCVLAEEIGHCLYPPVADHRLFYSKRFYTLDSHQKRDLRRDVWREERAARCWAADVLIPDYCFWDFFDIGPHEMEEWCERFDVEPWLVAFKIAYLHSKGRQSGGRFFKWHQAVKGSCVRALA